MKRNGSSRTAIWCRVRSASRIAAGAVVIEEPTANQLSRARSGGGRLYNSSPKSRLCPMTSSTEINVNLDSLAVGKEPMQFAPSKTKWFWKMQVRSMPFLEKSIGWKAASWKRFWKSGAQPHPQGVNEPVDSRGSVTITPLRPLHMAQQNAYSLFIRLLYRVT